MPTRLGLNQPNFPKFGPMGRFGLGPAHRLFGLGTKVKGERVNEMWKGEGDLSDI